MSAVTTVVITDPDLLARLAATDGPIAFCGPDGKQVRLAHPEPAGAASAGLRSPISDEEFQKRRAQPDGSPLAEVWKRIREKHGA